MSWLVIGKGGQLSDALAQSENTYSFWGRDKLDLTVSEATIMSALDDARHFDGIIISAAYTAVDKAEVEPGLAVQLNKTAPDAIARFCAAQDIPVIYVSTDYVFDGRAGQPYRPDAAKSPLNIYGHSKAHGEDAVMRANPKAMIVRTSGLHAPGHKNFVTTMLGLRTRPEIKVVDDQIMRPTYAAALASAIASMARSPNPGIYHFTGSGEALSWADFAQAIFGWTDYTSDASTIRKVSTSDYGAPARRPAYSVLDISEFRASFGVRPAHWAAGLDKVIKAANGA